MPNADGSVKVDRRRGTAAGSRRLIVLEADAWNRALIDGVLRACGYRVVCTGDPEMAVQLAREMLPDLVVVENSARIVEPVPQVARRSDDPAPPLSDVPSGYALLRPIESNGEAAQYPIVLLRHRNGTPDGSETCRFRLAASVPRPFTPELLLKRVRETLGPERRAEAAPTVARESEPRPGHAAEWVPIETLAQDPQALADWAAAAPVFDSLPAVRRNALVVDADPRFRAFLRGVLELQGFTVFEAGDADGALAAAVSRRPSLIVTEVDLPGLDGFELCFRAKNHTLVGQTPLVFLSGLDDYWERHHAAELGADDFLSKTVPLRELLIRLQLTLARYCDPAARFAEGAGMGGRIDLVGTPGILQMCHQGILSGICTFQAPDQRYAEVCFRRGEIVAASDASGAHGPEVVFELLGWTRGRFDFLPGEPDAIAPISPFEKLLLEGCRRMDEQRRLYPTPIRADWPSEAEA